MEYSATEGDAQNDLRCSLVTQRKEHVEHPKEDLSSGLYICGGKCMSFWRNDAVGEMMQ